MTYKEAYSKIIDAYFKDEIKPNDARFCFCGTLCNNKDGWFSRARKKHFDFAGYRNSEFVKMEIALFNPIFKIHLDFNETNDIYFPEYEDALFAGMCAALDVLKEIHRSRGEDVDETLTLTKRELICQS